ncbi:hypothetical protein [Mucilaginibacter sp. 44-25]|uniref:hypothetical protein n=1 Tax=Mucilaginibacter sp. 44-25 TaxID=1895794 RepID=UPI0025DAA969|nr:hypothetical protein [Mucilaginibacter sp. 44-25]
MINEELYHQYDLLLPSRYEGGFLVLALHEKISRKQIPEYFTDSDIRVTLEELAARFNQSVWQTDRIMKTLNYFFIKNVPDQFGKYYLSDYARRVVKLIENKLENPYKNYPLRETFQKYFTIRTGEFKTIHDLEIRFGRDFVSPYKNVIENHLDGLQDELQEAHHKLSDILISEQLTAIQMVHQFVLVFNRFGERAEDIGNAIHTKDRFLVNLHEETDKFYQYIMESQTPENDEEIEQINKLRADWAIASEIYNDLSSFFESVDQKLALIHKQILYATEKLLELQENFSTRSNFRLAIKRILNKTLDQAAYEKGDVAFSAAFPLKNIPNDKVQFFYPDYYFFIVQKAGQLIEILRDEAYEQEQKQIIENQSRQAEIINEWLLSALDELAAGKEILLDHWINRVYSSENSIDLALYAGFELVQRTVNEKDYQVDIQNSLETLTDMKLQLWKIRITSRPSATLS